MKHKVSHVLSVIVLADTKYVPWSSSMFTHSLVKKVIVIMVRENDFSFFDLYAYSFIVTNYSYAMICELKVCGEILTKTHTPDLGPCHSALAPRPWPGLSNRGITN